MTRLRLSSKRHLKNFTSVSNHFKTMASFRRRRTTRISTNTQYIDSNSWISQLDDIKVEEKEISYEINPIFEPNEFDDDEKKELIISEPPISNPPPISAKKDELAAQSKPKKESVSPIANPPPISEKKDELETKTVELAPQSKPKRGIYFFTQLIFFFIIHQKNTQ